MCLGRITKTVSKCELSTIDVNLSETCVVWWYWYLVLSVWCRTTPEDASPSGYSLYVN